MPLRNTIMCIVLSPPKCEAMFDLLGRHTSSVSNRMSRNQKLSVIFRSVFRFLGDVLIVFLPQVALFTEKVGSCKTSSKLCINKNDYQGPNFRAENKRMAKLMCTL